MSRLIWFKISYKSRPKWIWPSCQAWFGLTRYSTLRFGLVWYGIGHIRLHYELYFSGTHLLTFPCGWVVGQFGNKTYLKFFGIVFRSGKISYTKIGKSTIQQEYDTCIVFLPPFFLDKNSENQQINRIMTYLYPKIRVWTCKLMKFNRSTRKLLHVADFRR